MKHLLKIKQDLRLLHLNIKASKEAFATPKQTCLVMYDKHLLKA
jgi:hypothetical protein